MIIEGKQVRQRAHSTKENHPKSSVRNKRIEFWRGIGNRRTEHVPKTQRPSGILSYVSGMDHPNPEVSPQNFNVVCYVVVYQNSFYQSGLFPNRTEFHRDTREMSGVWCQKRRALFLNFPSHPQNRFVNISADRRVKCIQR